MRAMILVCLLAGCVTTTPVSALDLLPAAGLPSESKATIHTAAGDKSVSGSSKALLRTPEGLAYNLSLSDVRHEGTKLLLPDGMSLEATSAPEAQVVVSSPGRTIALIAALGAAVLAGTVTAIAVATSGSSVSGATKTHVPAIP